MGAVSVEIDFQLGLQHQVDVLFADAARAQFARLAVQRLIHVGRIHPVVLGGGSLGSATAERITVIGVDQLFNGKALFVVVQKALAHIVLEIA
ncbi:hypothetical protein SDC9_175316 [bioreactor metagenome]|uniref:Uncharacterized protein n=1 Tax=bioreactor metagenome TaxID=1076179 RepID=A0A645GPP1_9ZZZZ